MDWLDLLAVQGTLNSLLQHHSSKASILQLSAFFTVQLSHPYMTTGKYGLNQFVTTGSHPHPSQDQEVLLNTSSAQSLKVGKERGEDERKKERRRS